MKLRIPAHPDRHRDPADHQRRARNRRCLPRPRRFAPATRRRHEPRRPACGERALLPTVREAPADTIVVARGFSCRQIEQAGTGRPALHPVQVITLAREHGPAGPRERPDGAVPARPQPTRSGSRAAAALGASLAAAGAAGYLARR